MVKQKQAAMDLEEENPLKSTESRVPVPEALVPAAIAFILQAYPQSLPSNGIQLEMGFCCLQVRRL